MYAPIDESIYRGTNQIDWPDHQARTGGVESTHAPAIQRLVRTGPIPATLILLLTVVRMPASPRTTAVSLAGKTIHSGARVHFSGGQERLHSIPMQPKRHRSSGSQSRKLGSATASLQVGARRCVVPFRQ
jgi:hypothetical protein